VKGPSGDASYINMSMPEGLFKKKHMSEKHSIMGHGSFMTISTKLDEEVHN